MLRKTQFRVAALLLCTALSTSAIAQTFGTGPGVKPAAPLASATPAVNAAVASLKRTPQDVWNDAIYKPAEVLTFAGVKPGDTIVDFIPAYTYWTKMLSLIAGAKGQVYAFVPQLGCNPLIVGGCASATITSDQLGFGTDVRPQQTLIGQNTFNGIEEARSLEDVKAFGHNTRVIWNVGGQFSLPTQADVVFSFGQWHKLTTWDYSTPMQQFLKLLYAGIKPGGTLVIADYAAKPGSGFKDNELMRRSDKEAVKQELVAAGFTFVAESNVLAKPEDPHSRRVRDDDMKPRPDNDMFLLKFSKPANAPKDNRPTPQQYAGWMNTSFIHADTKPETAGGIWINADGSYNQQGVSQGSWFFDASGNFCMQTEAPAAARDFVGCYAWAPHKVGDTWMQETNGKPAQRTLRNVFLFKPQPPPPPKLPYTGEGDAAQ